MLFLCCFVVDVGYLSSECKWRRFVFSRVWDNIEIDVKCGGNVIGGF